MSVDGRSLSIPDPLTRQERPVNHTHNSVIHGSSLGPNWIGARRRARKDHDMKHDLDVFLDSACKFHRARPGLTTGPSPVMLQTFIALYHFFSQACRDVDNGISRMQVAAAPTGTGKSTATLAYAAHLWRTRGEHTVLLVPTIRMAEDAYRDARHLCTDEDEYRRVVNVFTGAHRNDTDPRARIAECEKHSIEPDNPSVGLADLPDIPILIATQNFWVGPNGQRATEGRQLIVLDEWTGRVDTFEVMIGDLDQLRDWYDRTMLPPDADTSILRDEMSKDIELIANAVSTAYAGMSERGDGAKYVPLEVDAQAAVRRVAEHWLTKRRTSLIPLRDPAGWRGGGGRKGLGDWLDQVFGFIVALDKGQAFKNRHREGRGYGGTFIGFCVTYEIQPGIVLLDATGTLDGISQIVSWRNSADVEVPRVDYGNLQPIIVDKPALLVDQRLLTDQIVENRSGSLDVWKHWVSWLVRTTLQTTEKALVICPKKLEGHLPPDLIHEFGEQLSITHWGHHTGLNKWRDCDVVYLLDEFHRPKHMTVAHVRGLQDDSEDRRPTSENLSDAQGGPLRGDYSVYQGGQLLASLVQGASRGRLRVVDEDGRCGSMRLYAAGDIVRLDRHIRYGFPGARPVQIMAMDEGSSGTLKKQTAAPHRIVQFLLRQRCAGRAFVTYDEIAEALATPRRDLTKHLRKEVVAHWLAATGAKRVASPGRGKIGRIVF